MTRLIVALTILVFMSTEVQAWYATVVDTVEVRWPNGNLKEQYQTYWFGGSERTWREGFYRSWRSNGQQEQIGEYYNGLKIHAWICWDSTGAKVSATNYVNDEKHGRELVWHPGHSLKSSAHYLHGNLHGRSTRYIQSHDYHGRWDSIVLDQFYIDGELMFTIREGRDIFLYCYRPSPCYNPEKDIWLEFTNNCGDFYIGKKIDGEKHGKWIHWSEDGTMVGSVLFDHGTMVTAFSIYD